MRREGLGVKRDGSVGTGVLPPNTFKGTISVKEENCFHLPVVVKPGISSSKPNSAQAAGKLAL